MDEALRPDLSRILPKPWLRQLADASPLAAAAPAAAEAPSDFLVDVTPTRELHPDDVGFGLAQAQAVATRIATTLLQNSRASVARLHELDPGSLATRLG